MERPTPSVNSSILAQLPGQTARLVGQIKKVYPNKLLLLTSDSGSVEVLLSHDSTLQDPKQGQFIEITGKINDNGDGIKEFSITILSDNLDLDLVDKSIILAQSFPRIFTDEGPENGNGMADY